MSWIRYILTFVLFMHGLAHLSGFLAAWTNTRVDFPDRPWLLSKNIKLRSPLGRVFGLLWLAAALVLTAAGFGLAFGHNWWPASALLGSALSLLVILPWLRSVPPGAWAGAMFDIAVILAMTLSWRDQILDFIKLTSQKPVQG